ncbi:hypothetical protein [Rubellicoccus peritrichatus]|uniref:Uncharacterized protein n=1 Tax=Rubellicoccus peritrichatus TaxID=3080537 RepID=A0AAQ3L738_9BACT|nr:hypothetical protein [Puniceicoccus sp. CR14]WOO40373.1 hypothetical protein RZN69_17275 [Puniceicoccus sp. CR14]WOO40422.1 hypothetical protein RZN69_17520 [Puniceicoccus sp. CR14]WOO40471.1 hypothetical protein RZN69_17765 [Puniceicoccus sp. CR14]WOO40520.1 hypothetical protein RZN69_18010 [Puniceicoccus sp. CR14]
MISWRFKGSRRIEDEVTVSRLNELIEQSNRGAPGNGHKGLRITQTPLGWVAELTARSESTVREDHPWKPYSAGNANNALAVKLIPGTINNELPNNWNGEITLNGNAEGRVVYLETNITQQGEVTGATIEESSTVPVTQAPSNNGNIPTTLYTILFSYDSSENAPTAFYSAVKTNLRVETGASESGCSTIYRNAVIVAA